MRNLREALAIAIKKASQSKCTHRISAIGFNKNGDIVAKSTNRHRFNWVGGAIHAEMAVMKVAKRRGIVTILICRIGRSGDILPIHPCKVCKEKADELNIKIICAQDI